MARSDCEQDDERKKVHGERLQSLGALIAQPAPERKKDSDQYERGRYVETMKEQARDKRANAKFTGGKLKKYPTYVIWSSMRET